MARIAIVEHDARTRDLVAAALAERGHEVRAFATVKDALGASLAAGERLDLLVTAVRLPDGDGLELVARLRGLHPALPAIVMADAASEDDYRRAFRAGATDCLARPFTRDELLARCAFRLRRGDEAGASELPVDGLGRAFGRYEVEAVLGRGSHGTVHAAHDPVTGQEVALKVLAPGVEDEVRLRFLREIYVLSSVRHPAVARVLDFGNAEGRLYHTMARVQGLTLRDHVLTHGRMSEDDVLRLLRPLASALAALDEAGLVHRDLKPANVILEGGRVDRPVLIDFGLAKRTFDRGLTDPETILGTPGFIAPEVALGHDADGRADVFALGLLALYGLLGGELYPELSGMALVSRMVERRVLLPQGLSPDLRDALHRMTALTPAERPRARDLPRLLAAPSRPRGER